MDNIPTDRWTEPLFRFLQQESTQKWFKWVMVLCMVLTLLSVFTSHSRGAFVTMAAMGLFMLMRTPYRIRIAIILVALLPLIYSFMPKEWHERMGTIQTYERESSAITRINSWRSG